MIEFEKSQQQAGNRGSVSYFRYSPQSQLLIGLLLVFFILALPFTAEAARPKVRIDKITPVDEGTVVTLNGSNTFDVDGKELIYMWRQVQGPDVVINNPNAPIATFTAPTIEKTNSRTRPVSFRFELEANNGDDRLATASRAVAVRVLPVNNPPNANAGPNRSVTWEAASSGIDLDASASTDDGQIIQYRWKLLTRNNQLPRGTRVRLTNPRAEHASFTFTSPDQSTPVTLDFELFVRDNDRAVDRATVSIRIETLVANAGSSQTVIAESPVTLSGAASIGAITTYAWQQVSGPPVTLSSPNSATTGFTAPTVTEITVLLFKLTTANNGGSSEDTVSVTVNPIPPVANAGNDQTVLAESMVTLSGANSTGTISSFAWEQVSGPTVMLANANSATTGFTAPSVTEITVLLFKLTTANNGGSSEDTVSVTVNPIPPVANAGNDQTVLAESLVTLSAVASTGTIDNYAWEQVSGPPVSLANANSATTGFTAPTVTETTVLVLKLTTANNGGSSEDTVSVTVNPVPIKAITPLNDTVGKTVEISVTGNDLPLTMVLAIDGQSQPCLIVGRSSIQAEFDCPLDVAGTWDLLVQSDSTINGGVPMVTSFTHFTVKGTNPLNDTGTTGCSNANQANLACPVAGFPEQDAQHGRDAQAVSGVLQKVGGGDAGFDFTKLDSNGNPLPVDAEQWDCVKDNVTSLVWEVKPLDGGLRDRDNTYSWYEPDNSKNGGNVGTQDGGFCIGSACDTYNYVKAINTQSLCGSSDWRMPDANELLSIMNTAKRWPEPLIVTGYFPNTLRTYFLSSTTSAFDQSSTMVVHFGLGNIQRYPKSLSNFSVRLVRRGQ